MKYRAIDLRQRDIDYVKQEFKILNYRSKVLTLVGFLPDKLYDLAESLDIDNPIFYIFYGQQVNEVYSLTGTRAYPSYITIVSIKHCNDLDIKKKLGAIWFPELYEKEVTCL